MSEIKSTLSPAYSLYLIIIFTENTQATETNTHY
jgi:hypothetical protein